MNKNKAVSNVDSTKIIDRESLRGLSIAELEAVASFSPISITPVCWTEKAKDLFITQCQKQINIVSRRFIRQYIAELLSERTPVSTDMPLDHAAIKGDRVEFKPELAVIKSTPPVSIAASRVPYVPAETNQTKKIRIGSDIVAASVGASTRWSGKEVVCTLPTSTLDKVKPVHVVPAGMTDLTVGVPVPSCTSGKKGRSWVYELMKTFQSMPLKDYYDFVSNWSCSVFGLPPPSVKAKISDLLSENFSLKKLGDSYYWIPVFTAPGKLRKLDAAWDPRLCVEEVYDSLTEYIAARQGNTGGVGMLAAPTGSWGLVGLSQVRVEQIVSLILGVEKNRVVIDGLTVVELSRVRASVNHFRSDIKVYQSCKTHECDEEGLKTSIMTNSLVVLVKPFSFVKPVSALKNGKVKSYSAPNVLDSTWTPVEHALKATPETKESTVVWYGALLPPTNTPKDIKVYDACSAWSSVFFASMKPLKFAMATSPDGVSRQIVEKRNPLESAELYKMILVAMNRSVTYWAIPPVHNDCRYSPLVSPLVVKAGKKLVSTFDDDLGDFVVQYADEEEPEEESDEEDEEEDEDDEEESESRVSDDEEEKPKTKSNEKKPKPRPKEKKKKEKVGSNIKIIEEDKDDYLEY